MRVGAHLRPVRHNKGDDHHGSDAERPHIVAVATGTMAEHLDHCRQRKAIPPVNTDIQAKNN